MPKANEQYEAREADISALCRKAAEKAEMDLGANISDMLNTWDALAQMGIETPSRADFLRMFEIVQNNPYWAMHPEVIKAHNPHLAV